MATQYELAPSGPPGRLVPVPRATRSLAIFCGLALIFAASAAAASWGGKDPPKNVRLGKLPSSCKSSPTGKACINAGVYYLNLAHKKVGLPPYALPADFPSLSPPRQIFILVNLDRIAYKLLPFPGLT